MKKAILFKKLANNCVRCTACNHYCKIPQNKTGICGVRKNIKGMLYLLVYGRAIAINIDPIEKKPLYHFVPGTEILSFGTVGCNFKCDFCQNWDISQKIKELKSRRFRNAGVPIKASVVSSTKEEFDWGQDWPPNKIVKFAKENKIPSIAYTYNEPAIFFEYAYDTAKLAKKAGLKNVYVSNGYESREARQKIAPYLDAINIDLKSYDQKFYQKYCGGQLEPVLENIVQFYKLGIHIEITTLIIQGKNDSKTNLTKIAKFIASLDKKIPWHISRFFPAYKMLDVKITPESTLENAREIGKAAGLEYVYIGNI